LRGFVYEIAAFLGKTMTTASSQISIDTDIQPMPPVGKGPKADNPRRSYRSKLATIGDVCQELRVIYRESRAGKLDVAECSRFANILSILSRLMSDGDLEARIEALESRGMH
jgi:hypothetical protein